MKLKNYTSEVSVSQTISRIEHILIGSGVSGIQKEYHQNVAGKIVALTFTIRLAETSWTIRMPVDEEKALQCLWLAYADGDQLTPNGAEIQYGSRKNKKRGEFRQQAERTAWKIMQDWIEVQMSMIQMQQADFQQVFLPYVWDGKQTLYDRVKATGFRAMLPEKTDSFNVTQTPQQKGQHE